MRKKQCFGPPREALVVPPSIREPVFSVPMATLARYVAVPAVPKVTSLRPLQNRKINSQYRVWVLKSPHHAHPKEVTKKHHGNRTPILRIMAKQVRYCEPPPYNSVPVLILVLFGLYRPPKSLLGIQNYVLGPPPWAKSTRNPTWHLG